MKSFKQYITEDITKGININDKKTPWTDMILSGDKTIETREKPTLNPYIGKKVALVQTGKGKARIVGTAVIGEPVVYNNAEEFRKDFNRHKVELGSEYDIKDKKYGYPLSDVKPVKYPVYVDTKGIVARNVQGIMDDFVDINIKGEKYEQI